MASSYAHCTGINGSFRHDLIENIADSYEACQEMHWMIRFLANNDSNKIMLAHMAGVLAKWDEDELPK
jgi:hypothetical protein